MIWQFDIILLLFLIVSAISILLVVTGLVFFLGAAVGILRFPDFYTRMHAAGKGDTLSTLLILTGLGIYQFHGSAGLAELLVFAKILAICAFIMLTSPTSTHALMEAGYEDGVEPLLGKGGENPMERKLTLLSPEERVGHATAAEPEPEPAKKKKQEEER